MGGNVEATGEEFKGGNGEATGEEPKGQVGKTPIKRRENKKG